MLQSCRVVGLQGYRVEMVAMLAILRRKRNVTKLQGYKVAGAEKQAISLRLMPMFFEHPRNGKEIIDFFHIGIYKVASSQVWVVGVIVRVEGQRNIVSRNKSSRIRRRQMRPACIAFA